MMWKKKHQQKTTTIQKQKKKMTSVVRLQKNPSVCHLSKFQSSVGMAQVATGEARVGRVDGRTQDLLAGP